MSILTANEELIKNDGKFSDDDEDDEDNMDYNEDDSDDGDQI